ncbi:MAG: hypothetical protein IJU76_03320 [Desulfovibrionaceae bacterium]|nr:hypothetical protein [Desulfovibrionaceae bacterium]
MQLSTRGSPQNPYERRPRESESANERHIFFEKRHSPITAECPRAAKSVQSSLVGGDDAETQAKKRDFKNLSASSWEICFVESQAFEKHF